jgi:hypothetical protein
MDSTRPTSGKGPSGTAAPRHGSRVTRTGLLTVGAAALAALGLASQAAAAPPANDSIETPAQVASVPASVSGRTSEATMDDAEPRPLAVLRDGRMTGLDRSVWFSYTSPRNEKLLAETCDANFESHIDIYSTQSGALAPVQSQANDYEECPGDRRSFETLAGVRYLLRVSALRAAARVPDGGAFHLDLTPQVPPVNDTFARATLLPGPGVLDVPLAFSTIEFGEPTDVFGTAGSVWYRLAPRTSQPYTAELAESPFDTSIEAFSVVGPTINGLRRIASDVTYNGTRASVSFNALRGRVYALRIGTDARVPAPVTLSLTTNTATGLGLIVTPLRNTVGSVGRAGLRASLSCARTCRLGVDLLVSPRDVRRYRLGSHWRGAKRPLRVGHVGGTLQTGRPQTVVVPITARTVRGRLAGARSVHFILRVSVRGARRSKPLTKVIVVRR